MGNLDGSPLGHAWQLDPTNIIRSIQQDQDVPITVVQVAAAWGVTGLDGATAGTLYNRVRTKLGVDQPPPELTTSYHPEYFAANAAIGVKVIEKPEIPDVCSCARCCVCCCTCMQTSDALL